MKRGLAALTMALTMLCAAPSQASFVGEENAALYRIWWESFQQRLKLRELLTTTREATEFAKETASFAQAAMQTGKNAYSIIQDPTSYFARALDTWYDDFPELHASLANAYTARDLFNEALHPDRLSDFDAYAHQRAFNALTMMTHSGFETLAHAVDLAGINDPYDRYVTRVLKPMRDGAFDNLEKVAHAMNRGGLTMPQASVHTAVATATSAAAQVEATKTLAKMNRVLEMQFAQEQADKKKAELEEARQNAAATRLNLKSWQLDPMPQRIGPYAGRP